MHQFQSTREQQLPSLSEAVVSVHLSIPRVLPSASQVLNVQWELVGTALTLSMLFHRIKKQVLVRVGWK